MLFDTGGNQRDLAREKNMKKQQDKGKKSELCEGNKGTSLQERKQRYVYVPTDIVSVFYLLFIQV